MQRHLTLSALALLTLAGTACAELSLPAQLAGKAVVLQSSDPDYARAVVGSAVKPAGMGGVSEALVVKITQDIPVYRMWNGPAKLDARGNTNRLGGWWSYDAPQGTVAKYRADYEICKAWNDLTWMATCTLKQGAVVAIGPGQSVSAETCGDPTGQEKYAANASGWQTYVDKPWARSAELVCPDVSADYTADPADISKKAP
ncbi:hypothetical protein [Zoogloea sp.]|uniref:hypothetical protein n=1 Tax=Zoogloea sp. TaxID=49181 RepID=UPI0035B2896D